MSTKTLVDHFNEYFEITLANTKELKEKSYNIRHQVYAEDLGAIPTNEKRMEIDEFDHYSIPLLLMHRRTSEYAGTMRLVIPPPDSPDKLLPFEISFAKHLWPHVIDTSKLPRGSFDETSRLAVTKKFRRRRGEQKEPFVIDDQAYTEQEQRFFPFITVGIYLGMIAMVNACNHHYTFGIFERHIENRLHVLGVQLKQVSEEVEYNGGHRALYMLAHDDFTINFNP